MLMVGADAAVVERELLGGELTCPECEGELRPTSPPSGQPQ